MNVRMGIVFRNVWMIDEFANIYSSLSLIVITLVGQLISLLKCTRESDSGERRHVYL